MRLVSDAQFTRPVSNHAALETVIVLLNVPFLAIEMELLADRSGCRSCRPFTPGRMNGPRTITITPFVKEHRPMPGLRVSRSELTPALSGLRERQWRWFISLFFHAPTMRRRDALHLGTRPNVESSRHLAAVEYGPAGSQRQLASSAVRRIHDP